MLRAARVAHAGRPDGRGARHRGRGALPRRPERADDLRPDDRRRRRLLAGRLMEPTDKNMQAWDEVHRRRVGRDARAPRPAAARSRSARRPSGPARLEPPVRDGRVGSGARRARRARHGRRHLGRGTRGRARALARHRVGAGRRPRPAVRAEARPVRSRLHRRGRARVDPRSRRLGRGHRRRAPQRRRPPALRGASRVAMRRRVAALARGLLRQRAARLSRLVALRARRARPRRRRRSSASGVSARS